MNKKLLQRMLDLADIKPVIKEGKMNLSNFELVKESVNGNTYAIVREKNRYYIKASNTKQNLRESDFDYLGGLGNKTKNSFSSYEEATRYLNLMFEEINNHYDNVDNINLLESDILNEKKFVLKLGNKKEKPKTDTGFGGASPKEKPAETGTDEFDFGGGTDEEESAGADEFDFGGEDGEKPAEDKAGADEFDFGGGDDEEEDTDEFDFGGGTDEEEDTDEFDFGGGDDEEDLESEDTEDEVKDIQSTTGKLGQQIRDVEDLSSDMQKWVAKSVLSALNLDNMDTEDKKDLIRTIKKKSKEESEEESEEENFDFGGEEENVEESYMSYMDDTKDPNLLTKADLEENDDYMSYMKDDYMSYMKDDYSEKELNNWLSDMEMAGFVSSGTEDYESYMDDIHEDETEEGEPRGGEPKLSRGEEILLDDESLYGLNPNKRYDRSNTSRAERQAKSDIKKYYNRNASPNYDLGPSEDWRTHSLPYDTNINRYDKYGEYMSDITDKFETYEQEIAYEDLMSMASEYGFTLSLCHADKTEDPEESTIYFDIKDGGKKLLKARINSVGNLEIGTMKGKHFIGEPIDSLSDFDETFDEEGMLKDMGPQREKSPERPGRETETKPGRERKPDRERPSRRTFDPPPYITPGQEPAPKAEDPTMNPAPAKEPSEKPSRETETIPGREKRPDRERPSRRTFDPPPYITPGQEPAPKAKRRPYDRGGDVEFS